MAGKKIKIQKLFGDSSNNEKEVFTLLYPVENELILKQNPIGLGYIAASLEKHNIPYRLYNIVFNPDTEEYIVNWLNKTKSNLIGISMYSWNSEICKQLIKNIKNINKNAKIIVGGQMALDHAKIMNESPIDICMIGECEDTCVKLYNAIKEKKDINKINGIAFRNKNQIIKTEDNRINTNIDSIPSPYIMEIFKKSWEESNTADYMISRGCPFNCTYCSWGSPELSGQHRHKSIEFIIKELKALKSMGVEKLNIRDGTFNFSEEFVIKLCKAIKNEDLTFTWFDVDMRADLISDKILKALRDIGVVEIGFGIESTKENTQNLIKKYLNINKIETAIRLSKKHRFKVHASIQLGLPGESIEDMKKTAEFVKKLPLDEIGIFCTRIQPGTELYKIFNNDKEKYENYCKYIKEHKEQINKIKNEIIQIFPEISTTHNIIDESGYYPHEIIEENRKYILKIYMDSNIQRSPLKQRVKNEKTIHNSEIDKIIIKFKEENDLKKNTLLNRLKEIYENKKITFENIKNN
jgi:radical SAM superfamily enzyme YgiQ (UPF0313 family)